MISIIGAGPAGGYLAKLLAEQGKEVTVYEEHASIGSPIQCTGIMTAVLGDLVPIKKEYLVNTINKVRIHAPNGKTLELKLKRPNYVVHRTLFDQYFNTEAQKLGVTYKLNHRLMDFTKGKQVTLKFANGATEKTDVLVGADGFKSTVAKKLGEEYKTIVGIQARYEGTFDPNVFEVYLGYGTFGWSVPENDHISRIGLGNYGASQKILADMTRDMKLTFLEWQSGPIPVYNPRMHIQHDNIYLLGDAATHVKATTFGGIVYGLMGAQELANVLTHGGNYQKACKKRFGKDLLLSLWMHRAMNKFTHKDYNELLDIFTQDKTRNIIETHERDKPSTFIMKLALTQPKLLKYIPKML